MFALLRQLLDPANLVSILGLGLGAGSILLALSGAPGPALVLLIWAGACDLVDGKVARLHPNADSHRRHGKEIDSLVDVCSFGVCPVVLLYVIGGMRHPLELALLWLYLICVVLRLARFNISGLVAQGQRRYWAGMPTTYMALLVPALLMLPAGPWRLRLGVPLFGLLMVSELPVPRPTRLTYAILLGVAVALSAVLLHHGWGGALTAAGR